MSMQIKFIKNPKGILAVDAAPGEIRWVPRVLANQLITRGFAVGHNPTEHREESEVAAVAPEEQAVTKPGKPKKRGRPQKENKAPEPPAEPGENSPAEAPVESPAGEPQEPGQESEPKEDLPGVSDDPVGLSDIPSAEDVFGEE